MKISYQWLEDYVSVGLPAEELAHKLTMAGLEVENISTVNGDTVFEIEVTPNRPDCLNMIGIAREVSAILDKDRKSYSQEKLAYPQEKCSIDIQDKQGCLRYMGTVINDVEIKQAPEFLTERIKAVGLRPINNIVDITNFCLMEIGQPLHAFDSDKLIGGKIIVRRAKKGEKIITIDDVERELDPSILVIADEKRPVAIAGIMGGKETEVTKATKNILLESAYFDPILIRRASRKLGLSSDSSYRFERGVAFQGVGKGSHRATGLILENAKGKISQHFDCIEEKKRQKLDSILIDCKEVNHFLGASFDPEKYISILEKLDFSVSADSEKLTVIPPVFRDDIKQGVDVMEEVARIIGYDQLPYSVPKILTGTMITNKTRKKRTFVRENLIAQGLNEIISYTMISKSLLLKTKQEELKGTEIMNPLSVDQEILRPSLLPSMLNVIRFNINRGEKNLKLFETGKVYLEGEERERVSLLLTGEREADWRNAKGKPVDFFDMKGVLEQLLSRGRVKEVSFKSMENKYFEEESVAIYIQGEKTGEMGCVAQDVLDAWGIKQKGIYYAEMDLGLFYDAMQPKEKFQPISEYPSIVWDISLAVQWDTAFEEIKRIAAELGGDLLKNIEFKEEYIGDKIAKGQRGVIFSLVYQSSEKTLTESEVSVVHADICQALVEKLGAVKR